MYKLKEEAFAIRFHDEGRPETFSQFFEEYRTLFDLLIPKHGFIFALTTAVKAEMAFQLEISENRYNSKTAAANYFRNVAEFGLLARYIRNRLRNER